MADFNIERVTEIPDYSQKTLSKRKGENILRKLLFFSLALLLWNGTEYNNQTKGDVAYSPIMNKNQLARHVKTVLKDYIKVNFKRDYPLNLQQGDKVIEFVADGYDPKLKVAYEWIAPESYTNGTDKEILSVTEQGSVSNFLFGSTYIIIIKSDDIGAVSWRLEEFIRSYRMKK